MGNFCASLAAAKNQCATGQITEVKECIRSADRSRRGGSFLDHQQFSDSPKKEMRLDQRKPFFTENISQVLAVGEALEAFGYVAIDFVIAVEKHAPHSCPCLQDPVFDLLWNISARFREIEKGRNAARFQNAADFVDSCAEVGCIPQRVATGDNVDGFGNDVKRSHILPGETDVRMNIAVDRKST